MTGAIALLGPASITWALVLDHLFGELPARAHPVVWIGHVLRVAGRVLPMRPPAKAFACGALVWMGLAALALRLNVHLGRPGNYVLNPQGRDATCADTRGAIRCCARTVIMVLVVLSALTAASPTWA